MSSHTRSSRKRREGCLPDWLFYHDCYPTAVRVNGYSKPQYLVDVLHILHGLPELQVLLDLPLGSLFRLPVRQCSVSGQLVHQLLCRQLCTDRASELWLVFGGFPMRFSLREFEDVTGLCCASELSSDILEKDAVFKEGSSPYWYKLIGGSIGSTTVESLVNRLKTEKNMPVWKKFRLCLVVIVEGVLLCTSQPVKPSLGVVELVKDVWTFLKYPWGRDSFKETISMVKAATCSRTIDLIIKKYKQRTMAVHGFPLAIQLWALRSIPALKKFLRPGSDEETLAVGKVSRLHALKSFHASNIISVEYDRNLIVSTLTVFTMRQCPPHLDDPALLYLEDCIRSDFAFSPSV